MRGQNLAVTGPPLALQTLGNGQQCPAVAKGLSVPLVGPGLSVEPVPTAPEGSLPLGVL